MRISNKILAGVFSLAALTSCVSETIEIGGEGTGIAMLNVDLSKPQTRAVSEVNNFPVVIYDAEGKQVQSYSTVAEVPAQITMAVGNYVVKSHTPGEISKRMDAPYYSGEKSMEILKGVTSKVDVLCKMQNSIITVNYVDGFKTVFTDWEITVDDGSSTVLSFTPTTTENTVHWYFGEGGVKELTVNFRATTIEGAPVSSRRVLTKDQADESYDDDRVNFTGGDMLVLNFAPVESTDGKLSGITINADVTFTETDETINVNVVDKDAAPVDPSDKGDGEGPGSGDAPAGGSITLNLPADMVVSITTDTSLGDTYIEAAAGIKSIQVKISSDSDEMISSLSDLNDNYGVDFVNGAEIVDNQDVVSLFVDLGQPLSIPSKGDKSYTFPIGNFFNLLAFLSGTHTFDLVITDMDGNTKAGKLTLTVE